MALIEGEFATALGWKVRRKANKTPQFSTGQAGTGRSNRQKVAAAVAGAPEVMVKVTGYGRGGGHVAAHLGYTSRHGDVQLEDERGDIYTGKDEVRELVKEWQADFGDSRARRGQRDTMHAIFSMPADTPSEAVREAVRDACRREFAGHEYVFALHCAENDDKTSQPHCHVSVKCRGLDGRRLSTDAHDIQRWRESFAAALRERGVDCEATARQARGQVLKPERQAHRHAAARLAERGQVTERTKTRREEAGQALDAQAAGQPTAPRPWEKAIAKRQALVRSAYTTAAAALDHQASQREAFSQREIHHDHIDRSRPTPLGLQAAAHVLQSAAAGDRGEIPAYAYASVRKLSPVAVVRDAAGPQVLLHEDARAGVGDRQREHSAGDGLRRPRTGDRGALGERSRGLTGVPGAPDADRALAQSLRTFVAGMPSIATRHQIEKARLAAERVRKVPPPEPAPDHGRRPDGGPQAPNSSDLDR